jgi:hypothetical protein
MTKLALSGKTDNVTEVIRSATHYLKEYKDFKDQIISEYVVLKQLYTEQRDIFSKPIDKDI